MALLALLPVIIHSANEAQPGSKCIKNPEECQLNQIIIFVKPNNKTCADKSNHNNHANYQVFILTLFAPKLPPKMMLLADFPLDHSPPLRPPRKDLWFLLTAAQQFAVAHIYSG